MHHRLHPADTGINDSLECDLAFPDLQVDLIDQHDGVLDQHPGQAHQPQQGHETEGLLEAAAGPR